MKVLRKTFLILTMLFLISAHTYAQPTTSEVHYNRGVDHADKGQYDQAIREYNKAIDINPKYADAYINRGLVYLLNSGNKIKACADWKKACELDKCEMHNIARLKGACE